MHKLTVIELSGCSQSHVVLSGQCLDKQMASPRRSAFWASWVIASASSSITNLKPFLENKIRVIWGVSSCRCRLQRTPTYLKMVLVLAKLKIGPRTTSIPRSSDAFNCKITFEKHHILLFSGGASKASPKATQNTFL